MPETFGEYLKRLAACKKIDRNKRIDIIKQLRGFRKHGKSDTTNKRISFVNMKLNPHLYGMFEWSKTKEGTEFWKEVADEGF